MTPGVAGAITMTISNTMWVQFGLQQRWSALVLSFAFGALVFAATRIPVWQRAMYYVLNSLIIFSAAAGGNYIGNQALETTRSASLSEPPAYAMSWPALTQPVYAAEPASPMLLVEDRTGRKPKQAEPREEIERLKQETQKKDEELERLRQELAKKQAVPEPGPAGPEQRQRSFFTPKGF
jgi:hypothetical protein